LGAWYDFCGLHDVSRETLEVLEAYRVLLTKWQARINLVGPSTLDDFWTRHVLDSAQLWALRPDAHHWLDIGTGAGLPGLVIAALGPQSTHVTLVEASQKRTAFLREAARCLGVASRVSIINEKIEHVHPGHVSDAPDVITARAFTSLDNFFRLAAVWSANGAIMLLPKGLHWRAEVQEAERNWQFQYQTHRSMTDQDAVILEVSGIALQTPLKARNGVCLEGHSHEQ
jgi:16S rRNA (guanine527-N7)-methyltransferase